jgi:PAS domain S-box-containing protein
MVSKVNPFTLFRNQYFLFITTVVLTIIINQAIIQYDLNQQNQDAQLINTAGRQRMLCQRISKVVLYLEDNNGGSEAPQDAELDTLSNLINEFETIHFALLLGKDRNGNTYSKSEVTDELLKGSTEQITLIVASCRAFLNTPTSETLRKTRAVIQSEELSLLMKMERIVSTYQSDAEKKLSHIKSIELSLAAISIVILIIELFVLFLPLIRRLKSANTQLHLMNVELEDKNDFLTANQAEIKSHLERITILQNDLQERERQYRELVEDATDMIYELDERGTFSYVNPLMESITEWPAPVLQGKVFHDIIHPAHKERVINFYKEQRRNKIELTYLEFPIVTRNNFKIWIGQNVRMVFDEAWVKKVRVVARDITVLYQANKALQANEELFRTLTQKAPVGIYQLDVNGIPTYFNPRWFEIVGLDEHQPEPHQHHSAIHPEDRARVVAAWTHAVHHRTEISLDLRYLTTKKGTTWVTNRLSPIVSKDNEVIGFIGTVNDITAMKKAQASMAENERRFRSVADNAPVGIFETDALGRTTYMNKRWVEITGLEPSAAFGDGWVRAIHVDDRHSVVERWYNAVNERKEVSMEFRFVNPQSGVRWVIARAVALFDQDNEITGFIGTISDVSELKEIQHKLTESEELYKLLSTNAKDLITLHRTDAQATRTYISPSVKFILGYEPEELIHKSPYDLMIPGEVDAMKAIVREQIETNKFVSVEYRALRKDGTIIWLESHSHPFTNERGKIIGFQTSSRDITFRKEFENTLRDAKQKAEEATLAKSQFLSMMSHEIRTPMNAIIGLTNLLMDEHVAEAQMEHVRLIKFSSESLLGIINDILDFSKIEAGKIALEQIDFSLYDLVQNLKSIFSQRVREKNIHFHLHYAEDVPRIIKGDQVRVNQILTNLLSNAIKFTHQGYVELSIQCVSDTEGRHLLQFNVKDTGIGIQPEKINSIFESFSQASSDTTRIYGGTGLGLTITKHLLHLMSSEIHIESQPGYGSRFYFVLPTRAGELHNIKLTPAIKTDLPHTKGIHVLLVDDNVINQVVAENFLKKWGMTVDVANDGLEALEMIQSKSYTIVLMDLQMPKMDGYEATRQIRSLKEIDSYFTTVPIIALTASAMVDVKDKVIEIGMNDFITKPFLPEELRAKISAQIHRAAN